MSAAQGASVSQLAETPNARKNKLPSEFEEKLQAAITRALAKSSGKVPDHDRFRQEGPPPLQLARLEDLRRRPSRKGTAETPSKCQTTEKDADHRTPGSNVESSDVSSCAENVRLDVDELDRAQTEGHRSKQHPSFFDSSRSASDWRKGKRPSQSSISSVILGEQEKPATVDSNKSSSLRRRSQWSLIDQPATIVEDEESWEEVEAAKEESSGPPGAPAQGGGHRRDSQVSLGKAKGHQRRSSVISALITGQDAPPPSENLPRSRRFSLSGGRARSSSLSNTVAAALVMGADNWMDENAESLQQRTSISETLTSWFARRDSSASLDGTLGNGTDASLRSAMLDLDLSTNGSHDLDFNQKVSFMQKKKKKERERERESLGMRITNLSYGSENYRKVVYKSRT